MVKFFTKFVLFQVQDAVHGFVWSDFGADLGFVFRFALFYLVLVFEIPIS